MLETAVVKAMDLPGSVIYAFGAKWGPEKGKPDKYFKFVPGNGIHDIHMNGSFSSAASFLLLSASSRRAACA